MIRPAPLADTADALRTERTDLSAYLDELRARAREVEPDVHALLAEPDRWDRLERLAADLRAAYPEPAARPPLYGVPVGVKDIFHAEGFPTKAGADLPPDALTGAEAAAVSRLREAGALVLGKTHTTEFAYSEPGPTRNPHDTDHTPGGSSSGSAAAVAAGLCPLALGTQTVGSVIRPAAFCGIVGVKPSFGRVPTDGVIPLSESVDHVGFFTQDVAGAELAAAVLCNEWDVLPDPAERPTLGVPEGPYLDQASGEARERFDEHLGVLEGSGYDVRRVRTFEDIETTNDRHDALVAADAALAHHEWFEAHGDRYAEATADLVREGRAVDTGTRARARAGRRELRDELETLMAEHGVDVWVSPAAPGPAPAGIDSTGDPVMNLPWTHAGLPTVALPAGRAGNGLPLAVQCAAPFMADEALLAWARGLAEALGGLD